MISAKQKANRDRFKKVMAEAKKIRAKNKSLTQAEAVKKAWAMYKPTKVGAYKKTAAKKVKRPLSSTVNKALLVAKKVAPKKVKRTLGSTIKKTKYIDILPYIDDLKDLKNSINYNQLPASSKKVIDSFIKNKKIKIDGGSVALKFVSNNQFENDYDLLYSNGMNLMEYYEFASEHLNGVSTKYKKAARKKTVGGGTHKDTKSHNVNIRVMSGFQEFNTTQVKELQHLTNSLYSAQYNLKRTIEQKKATRDKDNKMYLTRAADRYRDEIAGLKKQITIVKRLIK